MKIDPVKLTNPHRRNILAGIIGAMATLAWPRGRKRRSIAAPPTPIAISEDIEPPPRIADGTDGTIVMPMSSGVHVPKSASIKSRPQDATFKPQRIIIGGHPDRWVINEIRIDDVDQGIRDVPGSWLSPPPMNGSRFEDRPTLSLANVARGGSFEITVTYVGPQEAGEPFMCGVVGQYRRHLG